MDKPKGLGADGSALWDEIAGNEEFIPRPDEYRLLALAAKQLDVIAELEAAFAADPQYIVRGSTGQPVVNPLIAERRQAAAAFASLMRQLAIPDGEEREVERQKAVSEHMRDLGRRSGAVRRLRDASA